MVGGSGSGEAQGSQPLLAFPMVIPTLPRRLNQWSAVGPPLPTLGTRVFQEPEFPAQGSWDDRGN